MTPETIQQVWTLSLVIFTVVLVVVAVLLTLILVPAAASAQAPMKDISTTTRGPTSELYIRKRPPAPEAPVLSKDLKALLSSTEKRRDAKRLEAIGLLKGFLEINGGPLGSRLVQEKDGRLHP